MAEMNKQILFKNYKDVPKELWKWPNFTPEEISCRCNHRPRCEGAGSILIVFDALDRLQRLRSHKGKPFIINSAYRSKTHNEKVGGKPESKHLLGIAFDIALEGLDRYELDMMARNLGFNGRGQYDTFMHIDCREGKEVLWDNRTKQGV